jgi:ABC-type lipoprotein release transport system permease subunit
MLGIDPARERDINFIDDTEIEGRFLESVDDNGIVIGRKMADKLDTEVGKRIVIMSQNPENEIADRGFRVVGVFDAKTEILEETYVFAARKTVQDFLQVGDYVTEAVAMGDDYRDVEPVFSAVSAAVNSAVTVSRWYELNTYLGTTMKVMDGFVLIWVIVVFLVLSFGLVNTLIMAVFKRVREIGLMLALGMKPSSILGQVIIESMLLLVIGLVIGNVLAIVTIEPLKSGIDISVVAKGMEMMGASSVLYPQLRLEDVLLANAVVLILGFLASLSPAWRASRYQPVEAITKAD